MDPLQDSPTPAPLPERMDRLARFPELVVRNLQITQAYHDLSSALMGWTGTSANWCTFATWASKQAGQTIRGEDLPRAFERRFEVSPEIGDAIGRLVAEVRALGGRAEAAGLRPRLLQAVDPAAAFARASAAVSRGNTKVFAELGPLFARFVTTLADASTRGDDALADFLATLRPGASPDGQDDLKQALQRYHQARFTADPARKLQLVLLGNLLIGRHEQRRLQPEIREAMDASLGDAAELRARVIAALVPGFWLRTRQRASRLLGRPLPLDRAVDRLIGVVQRLGREVVTEHLMTLGLPDGEIVRLGRDLRGSFPPELQTLTVPELAALLTEIDVTPESVSGTGTRDWSEFGERMHFIADLFRCHATRPALYQPPFTPEQVQLLAAGQRPTGRL